MKKCLSFLAFCSLCYTGWAQDNYYPLLEEGKRWEIYYSTHLSPEEPAPERTYEIKGDTVINGVPYKKVFVICNVVYNDDEKHYFAALSEREQRVYSIRAGSTTEKLLYDFTLKAGDTYDYKLEESTFTQLEGNRLNIRVVDVFPWHDKDRTCWGGRLVTKLDYGHTSFCVLEGFGSFTDTFCPEYWIHSPITDLLFIFCYNSEGEFIPSYPYIYGPTNAAQPLLGSGKCSKTFDLQGRRLTREPSHGVFIKDGKKVMR